MFVKFCKIFKKKSGMIDNYFVDWFLISVGWYKFTNRKVGL